MTRRTSSLRRFALSAPAALLVAFVAGGCGGGGEAHMASTSNAQSAPSAQITKAQYVARANAICAHADPALSAALDKLASDRQPAVVAVAVRQTFVPAIEAQMGAIRALGAPSGEQAQLARMFALVRRDLAKLKRNPRQNPVAAFRDFATVAHSYGLTDCAPLS